jgi:hypothetical protein
MDRRRALIEYSAEADVSITFAWNYWTDVGNWDDPPAQFTLDGPFAEGSRGTTRIPGHALIHWTVRDVTPGRAATIAIDLGGATLAFEWRFEHLANRKCLLTQSLILSGEKAGEYAGPVRERFEASLPAGMARIARLMSEAHRDRLTRPMELIRTEAGASVVAEAPRGRRLFLDVDDTGRLLERCFSLGAEGALLYAPNLSSAFFDLSSGEAGSMLQRLRNFRIRLAVVCPPGSVRFSRRFGEMLAEEQFHRQFGVFEMRQEALDWLST